MLYYVLIQGLLRAWQIRHDIRDGIRGVPDDPQMAVRLGPRALPRLRHRLSEADVPETELRHTLTALGRLGDEEAFAPLASIARDQRRPEIIRAQAVLALGDLANLEAIAMLDALLDDPNELIRERSAQALGLARRHRAIAVRALQRKLDHFQGVGQANRPWESAEVRKHVVEALGLQYDSRCEEPTDRLSIPGMPTEPPDPAWRRAIVDSIISPGRSLVGVEEEYLRVKNRAATALGQLGCREGFQPLIELVEREGNPKLVTTGIKAIRQLVMTLEPEAVTETCLREAATDSLLIGLRSTTNDSVRCEVARALGELGDPRAVQPLLALFDTMRKEKNRRAAILVRRILLTAFRRDPQVRAWHRRWRRKHQSRIGTATPTNRRDS